MLILTRKAGQSFLIGDNIEITVTELSSDKVKIGIEAPKDVCILRKELLQTMQENKQAAGAASEGAVRLLAAKFPPKPPTA